MNTEPSTTTPGTTTPPATTPDLRAPDSSARAGDDTPPPGPGQAAPRRQTRQRAAVEQALQLRDDFVSAQQLHDQLRHAGTSVGLATVYRTLQSMADAGELDTVRSDDGETRFRQCVQTAHHHHLVCRSCGRTVELSASEVEAWATRVAQQYGFSAVEHQVELFGLCSQCAPR